MNVSLTPELKNFVEKQVSSGHYQTASEVVRAALSCLQEDQFGSSAKTRRLADLEKRLLAAVTDVDAKKGVDGRVVFRRMRQRIKGVRAGA